MLYNIPVKTHDTAVQVHGVTQCDKIKYHTPVTPILVTPQVYPYLCYTLLLGYDFLLHMFSFYIYLPSYENPKTLRYALNYCLQCYYKYSRTLLIITEYLKPERSHRTTGTVTSLSFNSLSKSGKYLVWNAFLTRSRGHPIPSPRPRASVAKNKLL